MGTKFNPTPCGNIFDYNSFKTRATLERPIADACHRVRDSHARQARAIRERKFADARYGVRDRHTC